MANYLPSLPPSKSGELLDVADVLELRRSVFPLVFSFLNGTFYYHGTCFCTGYSGVCLSAMHVISDGWDPRKKEMRSQGAYGVLATTGISYGTVTRQLLRPFVRGRMFPQCDPLSGEPDPSRIGFDVATVAFDWEPNDNFEPLWVRTDGRAKIKPGSTVIAIGFDEVTAKEAAPGASLEYHDRLRACRLTVQETMLREPIGMGGGPLMIFDANVPPGFSGGPVFTEDGAVVGLISTGSQHGGYGSAVWLERYPVQSAILSEQNHDNPDWFGAHRIEGGTRREPDALFWREHLALAEMGKRTGSRHVRVWRSRTDPESSITA